MSKCYRCNIELEQGEKEICLMCAALPTCSGCGVIDIELCETCEGWEERMEDTCWKCNMRLGKILQRYRELGNLCAVCDLKIEVKAIAELKRQDRLKKKK